jgi:hypothetical protein
VAATSKAEEKSVSAESDVVAHHSRIHPDQFNGKGVNDEFHLDCDSAANDLNDSRFWEPVNDFGV